MPYGGPLERDIQNDGHHMSQTEEKQHKCCEWIVYKLSPPVYYDYILLYFGTLLIKIVTISTETHNE